MGDQERFLEEEEGSGQGDEIEVGKKVGFLPAFILKILKWVAIVVGILLLVVIVVVILFNQLSSKSSAYTGDIAVGMEVMPPEEILQYFGNIAEVRGQTADKPPQLFTAKVDIGYEKENNALTTELNDRAPRIHNIILIYLSRKQAVDLHMRDEQLQQELVREVNRILRNGKIKTLLFRELQTFQS
ncbi:MAG: hypothetical protein EHM28_13185 [Spirochaetaceae bacterium]|nr:MAG: hypothetical protein EHM28_13185 [Spirochaetaceae bacterium]